MDNNKDLCCKWCLKILSSVSSLNYHQKSSKRCLVIQKKQGNISKERIWKCDDCNKEFTAKIAYETHREKCKLKKEIKIDITEDIKDIKIRELLSEIKQHKINIKMLETKLEKYNKEELVSSKNKPMLDKLPLFSTENIKESVLTHISSYSMAHENIFIRHLILCVRNFFFITDTSRNIGYYRTEHNVVCKTSTNVFIRNFISACSKKLIEFANIMKQEITENNYSKYTEEDITIKILHINNQIIRKINLCCEDKQNTLVSKASNCLSLEKKDFFQIEE